ncbi:Ion channel regulatory protein [Aphelenchoides avenae]|nr:Ion channel regulatory protein [Aphelenchus avenae]
MQPQTLNVLQVSVGFFFIFFAFNAQGFIEQTVIEGYAEQGRISTYAGYISLAIVYGAFSFGSIFSSPIVNVLTAKWSMVSAAVFYGLFEAGFLFLNEVFLYISSALLGFSAAVLWSANGKFMSLNSTKETAGKHSGLSFAIYQSSSIFGGIFLLFIFNATEGTGIPESTVRILYTAFTVTSALGIAILVFLRTGAPPATSKSSVASVATLKEQPILSHWQITLSTFKLCATAPMLLMAVGFAYSGIELSFRSAIFPTCISFTQRLGSNTKTLLAFSVIVQGIGQAFSGTLFGVMGAAARLGRSTIIIIGSVIHLAVYIAVSVSFPREAPLRYTDESGFIEPSVPLTLICGFFLGFGDACWNTQIGAFLVVHYSDRSAQAFSLFRFFQSLLCCAAFFYGTMLEMQWHMLILTVMALAGCTCYVTAERITTKREAIEPMHM